MLSDIRTDTQQLISPMTSSTASTPSSSSAGSDSVEASETPDAVAAAVASAAGTASSKLNSAAGLTAHLDGLTLQTAHASSSSFNHSTGWRTDSAPATPPHTCSYDLIAADTADEVQLMAAQVLQRKHTPAVEVTPALTDEEIFNPDPLKLLKTPEKNLRARKEQLMARAAGSGGDGVARVAAVKEELAGVQARLRDALGLQPSAADEFHTDFYQPTLLKRVSYEVTSRTSSCQDGTAERLSGCGSSSSSRGSRSSKVTRSFPGHNPTPAAPRPTAPSHKRTSAHAAGLPAAAVPKAKAAAESGAGVASGAELPRGRIYFDSASEVAEMAARVLKKHSSSSQQEHY